MSTFVDDILLAFFKFCQSGKQVKSPLDIKFELTIHLSPLKNDKKTYDYPIFSAAAPTSQVPQRGTPGYFTWMYSQTPRPPAHWSQFTSKKTIRDWYLHLKGSPCKVTDPDPKIRKSIESAFTSTFQGGGMGSAHMMMLGGLPRHLQGQLGPNTSGSVKIISIKQIENVDLYLKYTEECQRQFRKAAVNGSLIPVDKVKGSTGKTVALMKHLDRSLTQNMHHEINEYYFFHGTKANAVDVIKSQGLDSRVANSGRIGAGVYGAEVSSKSAQYVGKC